jgi:hypothetical protein
MFGAACGADLMAACDLVERTARLVQTQSRGTGGAAASDAVTLVLTRGKTDEVVAPVPPTFWAIDTHSETHTVDTEMADGGAGGKRKAAQVNVASLDLVSPVADEEQFGGRELGVHGPGAIGDSPTADYISCFERAKRICLDECSASDATHFRQAQSTAAPPWTPRAT